MAIGFTPATIRVLLAASMLAWSLAPPALQHAHPGGGDLSHHHGNCADLPRELPGAGAVDAHQVEHFRLPIVAFDSGNASHLHWQWLGLWVTLPAEDAPADDDQDGRGWSVQFTYAGRVPLPQVLADGRLDKAPAPPHADALAVDEAFLGSAIVDAQGTRAPHPLCDRARRERSGVLLA